MNDTGRGREPCIAHLKADRVEVARRIATRDDVSRLMDALEAEGIIVTEEVAYAAWRRHSDWHEAGWLVLYPEDEDLRLALLPHLDVED